jgi:hypothetical protein
MTFNSGLRSKRRKTLLGLSGVAVTALGSSAAVAAGISLLYVGVQMPQSLIPNWLVRPLAILSVATVNNSGGLPVVVSDVNTSQTVVTPKPSTTTLKPMRIGMNLEAAPYYSTNRIFANLTMGAYWRIANKDVPADQLDANGNVIRLDTGQEATWLVNFPQANFQNRPADIVCRWKGKGRVVMYSSPSVLASRYIGSNEIRYTVLAKPGAFATLTMTMVDANDPVREVDCRETDADPKALFDPDYIKSHKGYDTIRFMDWMQANGNTAVTWATRTKTSSARAQGTDGYAIEHMIALANETKSNPWFNMPWNADAEYYRKFAETVRDTLDPNLKVYVETGNEVWNYVFLVTVQATNEGVALGYGTPDNFFLAMTQRYAEKMTEVNKIWTDVFKGQESRLVRVAAIQDGNANELSRILEFRDTAAYFDAVAVAPYFGFNLDGKYTDTPESLNQAFADLRTAIDSRLSKNVVVKQMADQFGKRLVVYEGGQHLIGNDVALLTKINRDPRMGQLYTYYLSQWQQNFGDLLTLYFDTGSTSKYGAWGLNEYAGQPMSESSKARATYLFMRSLGQ